MSLKMKELPISERPYEKLEMYGADALSNSELLAIIIKTGTINESSVTIAQKILNLGKKTEKGDIRALQELTIKEFMQIKGIGKIKAIQLKAVCEITKRLSRPIEKINVKIKQPLDIVNLMSNELRHEKREIVKLILLNSKNIILKIIDISFRRY